MGLIIMSNNLEDFLNSEKERLKKRKDTQKEFVSFMCSIEGKNSFSDLILTLMEIDELQRNILEKAMDDKELLAKAIDFFKQIEKLHKDFIKDNSIN